MGASGLRRALGELTSPCGIAVSARVGPERAAPLMYMMPVYASVLGALFIGERVQGYQVAGGALVLAGLWMARKR